MRLGGGTIMAAEAVVVFEAVGVVMAAGLGAMGVVVLEVLGVNDGVTTGIEPMGNGDEVIGTFERLCSRQATQPALKAV